MRGVRDTELGDFQRAARTLLVRGILTARVPGEAQWRNVRRYAEPLDQAFFELAGYRVERGRSAVCLVRATDELKVVPIFSTPSGRPFERVRYALVVLTLAALERSGGQTTLTDLARRIRRSVDQIPDLPFDTDAHASRLALSHAVRELERYGALSLTDGSREAWEQGVEEAEALYDIDREICRALFPLPRGLQGCGGVAGLLVREPAAVGRDEARRLRRQRLARLLLERPVMYFDELSDEDLAFLHREAGSLAEQLDELTGATLERRKEGLALVDPGRHFSDIAFPRGGANQQAALLLAERICEQVEGLARLRAPHGSERAEAIAVSLDGAAPAALDADGFRATPRVGARALLVERQSLERHAEELCEALAPALKAAHREDPMVFLDDAIGVLESFDLVRTVPGGIALLPALARFRELRVEVSHELEAQLSLFGGNGGS